MSVTAARLDAAGVRAWPALETERLDGWLLRAARGSTRRANSVWPATTGTAMPLPARLAAAERFYADRRLAPAFQLSPASPPGLDEDLAARGYQPSEPVLVQTRSLDDMAAGDGLETAPSARWFELWSAAAGLDPIQREVAREILARVEVPSAYALVDGVAVGRGVLDGEWLGVFSMATLPAARRRGAARAVLEGLLRWGRAAGATHAYLQVHSRNEAGQRLYERAGFATAYRYWFRVSP